jgi:flagellar motor switch protein FliG
MMTEETPTVASADIRGARKAALLVVSIDPDAAARVLSHLAQPDQERLALEVARLEEEPPSKEEIQAALREFIRMRSSQQYAEQGGLETARQLLERALPPEEARRVYASVESELAFSPFGFLRNADTTDIVAFLADEHPQTVALILGHLGPGQAADVLKRLPLNQQQEVLRRLARLERASPEAVEQVRRALESKLASQGPGAPGAVGGVGLAAAVLNLLPGETGRALLEGLDHDDPGAAGKIRRILFSFEDLLRADDNGLQRLISGLEMSQLALALKTASSELREKFLGVMEPSAAQWVRNELEAMGPVRISDIEAAQGAIAEAAWRQQEAGELLLGGESLP